MSLTELSLRVQYPEHWILVNRDTHVTWVWNGEGWIRSDLKVLVLSPEPERAKTEEDG